jgi:histone acetyltransferase
MPREQWVGYIKDYDGGTLMEFAIHPAIPYADLVSMFKVRRCGAARACWWGIAVAMCRGPLGSSGALVWPLPPETSSPLSAHTHTHTHTHTHACTTGAA